MFRSMMKIWLCGFILVFLAAACTPTAPVQDNSEKRLGDLESKVNWLSQLQIELTSVKYQVSKLSGNQAEITKLNSRLDDLQAKIDSLTAEIGAIQSANDAQKQLGNPFDVAVAQYVLDSSGIHDMTAQLDATKKIDPSYLASITKLKKVLSNVKLPAELVEQNQAFITQLDDLAAALATNKVDEAVDLVKKVHSAQHAYTKAIDNWLSNTTAKTQ